MAAYGISTATEQTRGGGGIGLFAVHNPHKIIIMYHRGLDWDGVG